MIKENRMPRLVLVSVLLSTSITWAQPNVFYNKGILKIKSKTILSTYSDFTNQKHGNFTNDGLMYSFGDFTNNGDFTYTKSVQTGEIYFVNTKSKPMLISGNEPVILNNATFDNQKTQHDFDLKANLDIGGEVDFKAGIIQVDPQLNPTTKQPRGMVSFMPKAQHKNSDTTSFVDGIVEKVGADPFVFPVGNKQHYRPAHISAPPSKNDVVLCAYVYDDSAFFELHQTQAPEIIQLNTHEYWKLEKASNKSTPIVLTLSWDEHTTLPELLLHPGQDLHIVYWNAVKNQWEDLGGIIDVENKTITTPANIDDFGYFTLASTRPDTPGEDDIIIYNYINTLGGDENDYFRIKNINKYPQNTVQIFNRWGAKVYETKNYDSQGNVFKGNQTRGGKLPAGTYYYLITYTKETKNTSYTVKKTGYLHLDAK